MLNKGGVKLLLTLGLVVFALVFLPNQSWAKDTDGDGYNHKVDCDDGNAGIYPGAPEICGNSIDEDCDGAANPCGPTCTDGDSDGYYAQSGCGTAVDCDDTANAINPGAIEACNGLDDNCDGLSDEVCSECTDTDGDTFYAQSGCGTAEDCDDGNGAINPGASEDCSTTGDDDNCDGQVNEGCPAAGGDDSDGDRILDADEITNGIVLSSEFDLWDENTNTWIEPSTEVPITILGSSVCPPGDKCLNPYVGDLFVIFRQMADEDTKINFENTGEADYCNIFDFASSPISNLTVWVLRERGGVPSSSRLVTAVSDKKAAVLIEDPEMSGTTGYSLPGSIQIENGGLAWIYTYQIVDNVDSNCTDPSKLCVVEGVEMTNAQIECRHFSNTSAHEIWHVLSALLTSDGHTTETVTIMYPSTVFTQKGNKPGIYSIGDEFSAAGLADPSF